MGEQNPQGILTFDVEDWHHANFRQLAQKKVLVGNQIEQTHYAMNINVDRWIEVLAEHKARSTCFVLGEFALRYPNAVQKLAQAGHEIASHGFTHDLVYEMTQLQFREFLKKSIGVLGDLTGSKPKGFRAPSWSVNAQTPWLVEELEAQGILYDSSIFPVSTPLFGDPNASLFPFWAGKVLRIPASVFSFGQIRIPFSSGAFFRMTPLPLIRWGFQLGLRKKLLPMIVLHPRELDSQHPRLPLHGWESWIHYLNLRKTIPKLQQLLKDFRWTSIEDHFSKALGLNQAKGEV